MKSFMEQGNEVVAIAPYDEYSELLEKEGIRCIVVEMDCKGTSVIRDAKLIKKLHSIYKSEKFDFVFHYTIKPVIYGSIVCRLLGIPCIAVTTGLGYAFRDKSLINRIAQWLYKVSLKSTQEVWFLNRDDYSIFIEQHIVPEKQAYILYGEGIDSDHFLPQQSNFQDDKFRVLLFSRLLKDKGVVEYAMAAKVLSQKYPNIEFRMLGKANNDTPENVPMEDIEKWQEEGYISYLGESIDVRSFIADSDCVVLPSYYREGIPRCLMEAMSMERPIVTTNNVGCIELIDDGVNGYMCEPRSAEDLADKIEKMYRLSAEERVAMGKAGRAMILAKFDERIVIQQYHQRISQYL
ncbi:MAG: glycosyltransferase family 4 protein [Paludibacteraceae bacterium]|nr:glycosyltransferase family 4 protein [Paludibacteraceae bacterium]